MAHDAAARPLTPSEQADELEERMMHELNDTGSFLWKNIDGKRSAAELAELLVENYEVTPDVALSDTQALLEEMSSRKLVVTVPATGGEAP